MDLDANMTTTSTRYAGFWIRVLALAIDILVLFPFTVLGVLAFYGGSPYLYAIAFLGFPLYKPLMESLKGATLGKMACGIRVVNADGGNISIGTAYLRNSLQILPQALMLILVLVTRGAPFDIGHVILGESENPIHAHPLYKLRLYASFLSLLDYLFILGYQRQKRTLHDLMARTYCVRTRMKVDVAAPAAADAAPMPEPKLDNVLLHRPDAKSGVPRWVKATGVLIGTSVGTVLIILMVVGSQGPDTSIYPGHMVPKKYVETVRALGLLEDDETIRYFYSDALRDISDGLYFVTDRHVVLYSSAWAEPATIILFEDIASLEIAYDDSFWTDSFVSLSTYTGIEVVFPISSESGLDRKFYEAISENVFDPEAQH